MKRAIILAAAAIIAFHPCASAGNDKYSEMGLTAGAVSIPQFAMTFGALFGTAFSGGLWSVRDLSGTGALSLDYYYDFGEHFALGAIGSFESFTGDEYRKDTSTGEYVYSGKYSGKFISLMPSVKFGWFCKKHFGMYSRLAAGGMMYDTLSEDGSSPEFSFAAQVSPICLTAGGGHFWGRLELGVGMAGLVCAGISYRF